MRGDNSTNGGIGFFGLLAIVFIVLKLLGFVKWSWIWVLAPIWIPIALITLIVIVVIIIGIFHDNR